MKNVKKFDKAHEARKTEFWKETVRNGTKRPMVIFNAFGDPVTIPPKSSVLVDKGKMLEPERVSEA